MKELNELYAETKASLKNKNIEVYTDGNHRFSWSFRGPQEGAGLKNLKGGEYGDRRNVCQIRNPH
jgi:hypothetical protein